MAHEQMTLNLDTGIMATGRMAWMAVPGMLVQHGACSLGHMLPRSATGCTGSYLQQCCEGSLRWVALWQGHHARSCDGCGAQAAQGQGECAGIREGPFLVRLRCLRRVSSAGQLPLLHCALWMTAALRPQGRWRLLYSKACKASVPAMLWSGVNLPASALIAFCSQAGTRAHRPGGTPCLARQGAKCLHQHCGS